MEFVVRKVVTYYAHIEAASAEEALEIAEDSNIIDLDADSTEGDWELA